MNTITDTQYRDAARRIYTKDTDDVEIDDSAPIARGSADGAFVQAWVWVDNSQIEERETNP